MVAIPSRHKSLVLLAGVIVLQVLMLAVQIKRDSEGRLIRVVSVGFATPGATTLRCKTQRGKMSRFAMRMMP